MRFWDSSALVPLVIDEATSDCVARWVAEDAEVVAWTLSLIEVSSALQRRVREGRLSEAASVQVEERLDGLAERLHLVEDIDAAKPLARRLLRVHPLRAADALQLAAALLWVDGRPARRHFHTFDQRLARAAVKEGFRCDPG